MTTAALPASRLERAAYVSMLAFAATPQFSIAASGILLGITTALWLALVARNREAIEVPSMFWPLAAYAGATLVASLFSVDPATSFRDSKQLVLFIVVPLTYRLLRGERSLTAVDVIITVGAVHAVYGIVQYGILDYDNLERRIQGLLGHYMTYSGVIMLVACTAAARILFRRQDRLWAALVMPALLVALALTASRNAWVGACTGIGVLFLLRDFRLVAILPVSVAVFIALAPAPLTERFYSMFRLDQIAAQSETAGATVQSNRDRLAMIRSGFRMIRDNPLTGVGPDMVIQVYPQYRDPMAVRQLNPHLHNVPLQIAAERGLPALVIWLWFVASLVRDFIRRRTAARLPSLATGGIACVAAMLAAGMFEYNFGDSEFLMLFLVLVTLPYAANREC
ncbi:MAG TPA: O-antigen ligase family protein [Vicinamibacterales bacterium]|nr:O-antigen ligase family protein [Vicinamibacterales bacterium]